MDDHTGLLLFCISIVHRNRIFDALKNLARLSFACKDSDFDGDEWGAPPTRVRGMSTRVSFHNLQVRWSEGSKRSELHI